MENGYMRTFEILQGLGSLIIVAIFLIRENTNAIVPLVLFPIALGIWLGLRTPMYIDIVEKVRKAQVGAVGCMPTAQLDAHYWDAAVALLGAHWNFRSLSKSANPRE